MIKILMVEDNTDDIDLIQHELRKGKVNFVAEIVQTSNDYENALRNFEPDIILSDFTLPSFDGPMAFQIKEKITPFTPFIFVSGTIGEEKLIEFIKNGVTDFVVKDRLFNLTTKVNRALKEAREKREKSETEQLLIQNENRLAKAQQIAHLGSWEVDFATNTALWSDEACRIYGLPPQENVQSPESFLSFVHPEDFAYVTKIVNNSKASLLENSFYYRIIRKDGAIRHIHVDSRYELDANGKPISLYGISHDITEIKEMEEELHKSERNFRAVFESTDVGFLLMDNGFNVIARNVNIEMWSKTMLAEPLTIGMNLREKLIPEKQIQMDQIMAIVKQGNSINHEVSYRNDNDGLNWFLVNSDPVFDGEGKVVGVCLAVNNITEKKLVEQKIENSEIKYRQLFYNNPMPLWVLDSNSLKFLDVNDAALNHYGYSREEFLSLTALDLRPLEERERFLKLEHSAKTSLRNVGNWKHLKKDGTMIYVEINSTEIIFEGISAKLVLVNDVTNKLKAENDLKELNQHLEERVQERTAELTEANKALEAYTSTVSHDLRAPVCAIIGFAKIIQQEHGARMLPEEKEFFGYIEDSAHRMTAIIDDLLKLAKYGEQRLKLEPVDMTRLIKGVWLNISRTVPHHAILQLSELPLMTVDMSMLQQVIVNLLSNAIKYSSKVREPVVRIWSEQTEGHVTIYFKDNGAGFDMQHYDRLFGAFQRLHGTTEFEGTGVGLTLVKRIIEKHGGTVGAEGKKGDGATFYFTLPLCKILIP